MALICPSLWWFEVGVSRFEVGSCFLLVANAEWPGFLPGAVGLLLDIRYLIIFDRMLVSGFYIMVKLKGEWEQFRFFSF
jgi:hypothetical protein